MEQTDTPPSSGGVICLLCCRQTRRVRERCAEPYAVYFCPSCDFAFVWPMPEGEMLHRAYDHMDYYAEWITSQAASRAVLWRRRARRVLTGRTPGRLLDVGCGEGSFLHEAQALGWAVAGTEISETACHLARQRWGLEMFCGPLESAKWPSASFDVVTLWHVVEHVVDPVGLIQEVARLTRPDGLVVVACPNRRSWLYNLAYWIGRGRWPHLFQPSDRELHVSHFTQRSLRLLFERCALQLIWVDVDRGHVQPIQAALDLVTTGIYRLTGRLWSPALEVWATKPSP